MPLVVAESLGECVLSNEFFFLSNPLFFSLIFCPLADTAHRQQTKEPLQKTERRDWAETVLDNPELLLMYAQSSGDVSAIPPLLISLFFFFFLLFSLSPFFHF